MRARREVFGEVMRDGHWAEDSAKVSFSDAQRQALVMAVQRQVLV